MYLISSKYYLKRRVTNKVVKRFLRLNTTLFIDRDIYRNFTIPIYFAPCVGLYPLLVVVILSPHEKAIKTHLKRIQTLIRAQAVSDTTAAMKSRLNAHITQIV